MRDEAVETATTEITAAISAVPKRRRIAMTAPSFNASAAFRLNSIRHAGVRERNKSVERQSRQPRSMVSSMRK